MNHLRKKRNPAWPNSRSWEQFFKLILDDEKSLNYLIDGFNLYSYKQANKDKQPEEREGISGKNYHMTVYNKAAEGKYYIRKEEKKPTIYFMLLKNHPDGIFKGTDYRPCKVGYTGPKSKSEYDRAQDVAINTSRNINENKKYKNKMPNKCEFEVIKLPISATSTESFYKTETTIREKFGEKLSGEETEKKIIELFGKSIDKTKDEKKEIKKLLDEIAKDLCLDAPKEWIIIEGNRFNDLKKKLNKIEKDRKQVPNTQLFSDWYDEYKNKPSDAGAVGGTSQGPGDSGGDSEPSEGTGGAGKGKDPGPSKSTGGTGKGKDPCPSKSGGTGKGKDPGPSKKYWRNRKRERSGSIKKHWRGRKRERSGSIKKHWRNRKR